MGSAQMSFFLQLFYGFTSVWLHIYERFNSNSFQFDASVS